jgi:putative membrane-bound dehydrogenase-like protein
VRREGHAHLLGWCLLAIIVALSPTWTLTGAQRPETARRNRTVQLTPAEAARLANAARQGVSVQIAQGLDLTAWAPDGLVIDPVALDLDGRGRLYATSTSRNNLPLDIRQHPAWVAVVHTLGTVEDLRQFYQRELAPERSANNPWLLDQNKDGSRDWRDLAELKERVYRIEDTDGDGLADLSRIMIQGFNTDPTYDIAGGLLLHNGDLFVGLAPALWRLRDGNDDAVIDSRAIVSEGYNTHPAIGGHGISGVTLGPDGRVYWEVGDMGFDVVDQSGRRWSSPNQGAVLRANPDGSDFEVFATGIRNLQEFAFDEYGNLISVDNDGDYLGETERLVYLTEGSDSGWRSNWQYGKFTDSGNNKYNVWMDEGMFKPRFEGQPAYITPPIAPYHPGPAGMVYNPGTALSDEWRGHFFSASFGGVAATARIYAFRLKPDGAGFTLESDKVLLQGILTVGMKFGPDGALYLADWMTGWDSKDAGRIWKLDSPQGALSAARRDVRALLAQSFDARAAADLDLLLQHADMRVRQKAQFELVRRADVTTLRLAARRADHQLARIHGLWGIGQLARKDAQHAPLLMEFLTDADPEIRAQAARLIGDVRHERAADALLPLLQDSAPRARFFAAEALGRLAYRPAVAPLVTMLADNNDRDVYLRHAGSLALSRIGDPLSLVALSSHASRGVRIAAIVALRRMRHPDLARFLADADEQVVTEAARAINDDGSIEAALPALARVLDEKRFTGEPLLRRAISANLRLGTNAAAARVAAFAADANRPSAMRAEATAALSVWQSPSPLDRVDGAYHGPAPLQAQGVVRVSVGKSP